MNILFIFCLSFSWAQDGILKGKVKDGVIALVSASVSLGKKTVLTNANGDFYFPATPGKYSLVITHIGYNKIIHPITVIAGETLVLAFNMTKEVQMGEPVVLPSRSAIHRSNLNTAVPVDVINAGQLSITSFSDPKLMVFANIPSFNSPPQNIGPTSYLEPATLRGLAPDHLLVLVNGRRRHTTALTYTQNTNGRGSAGTDLNSIPRSAIDRIEVLRDGASAQRGSDAISGVINIELKKLTGKTSVNLQTGQRYEGDGEQINFGFNSGFKLFKKGFLNISADMRYRNPTDRSGFYEGTVYKNIDVTKPQNIQDSLRNIDDSLIAAKGFDRKKVAKVGTPDLLNVGIVLNGGYPLNQKIDLFWTGTLNYRSVKNMFASGGIIYRLPKDTPRDSSRINFELFPDGFLPYGSPSVWDGSGILGVQGKTNSGWHWEVSSVYGLNSQRAEGHNTNNASQQFTLGKNAPTDFYTGTSIFRQNTNDINFIRDFAKEIGGVKSFNLALGSEFRIDNYQSREGEEASWNNYDNSKRKAGGSQVFAGLDTSNAVNETRHVTAFYIETEVEKNDHFLFNVAGRYEYYSDFGGNLAGKLAMRYKFSDLFSLRGAISNGFRAPSMQQTWLSRTNQANFRSSTPTITGTFRNNHPIVRAFNIAPLGPERSINLSGGFTSKLSSHMSLTVDAYWIQIRDRIVLTGMFDKSIPGVATILLPYPTIEAVVFFTNAINTRTGGVDLVWNGNWNLWKGKLEVGLSANFTRTHLYGEIQTSDKLGNDSITTNVVMNREERGRIEWGQPHARVIFRVEYTIGKLGFRMTNIYFGKTAHLDPATVAPADEFFSPKINTGINIHYSPKSWLTIALGARNLFNVYPDPIKNYANTQYGVFKYDSVAPQIGYDGGYYYLNMSFNF